ncbi:MAG: hypothetical protein QOI41_1686 [Myxococcales bacterium]|nr:hypothetical protein [Myxococcales bacterium]
MKNFVYALVAGASFVGVTLLACSSSDTGAPAAATDAGGADVVTATDAPVTSPADAKADVASEASSDGSAACNTVTQAATEATMSTVMGAAPAATGGTIAPGTYLLKELNIYDPTGTASPAGPSGLSVTLVIAGNVMNSVQDLADGSSQTFSETFSVMDKTLKRDLTCPKVSPDLAAVYSVTTGGLVVYETDPVSMLVAGNVYAKQP